MISAVLFALAVFLAGYGLTLAVRLSRLARWKYRLGDEEFVIERRILGPRPVCRVSRNGVPFFGVDCAEIPFHSRALMNGIGFEIIVGGVSTDIRFETRVDWAVPGLTCTVSVDGGEKCLLPPEVC